MVVGVLGVYPGVWGCLWKGFVYQGRRLLRACGVRGFDYRQRSPRGVGVGYMGCRLRVHPVRMLDKGGGDGLVDRLFGVREV